MAFQGLGASLLTALIESWTGKAFGVHKWPQHEGPLSPEISSGQGEMHVENSEGVLVHCCHSFGSGGEALGTRATVPTINACALRS